MNIEKLKGIIPDSIIDQLPMIIDKYKIDTNVKLAHFLSQCQHESGGFKFTIENLNYSKDGLLKIFSKYFTFDLATACARQPEKIANIVYANRMGNGSVSSGDGYRYRGRGYIQLTGKSNYAEFDKTVTDDIITSPGLVASKYPLESAAWFFTKNKIWDLCINDSADTILKVTKRINGGTNGLVDRTHHFKQIFKALIS